MCQEDFNSNIEQIRWSSKPVFWHRSYCLISTGGATIETLRKYIEEQGSE
jgi:putative transposase